MRWLIFVRVLGISPIHNFLPILICIFHRKKPWRLCLLLNQMNTALTSALFSSPSEMTLVRNMPNQRICIEKFGIPTTKNSDLTPSSKPITTRSPTLQSLHKDINPERLLPRKTCLSWLYFWHLVLNWSGILRRGDPGPQNFSNWWKDRFQITPTEKKLKKVIPLPNGLNLVR